MVGFWFGTFSDSFPGAQGLGLYSVIVKIVSESEHQGNRAHFLSVSLQAREKGRKRQKFLGSKNSTWNHRLGFDDRLLFNSIENEDSRVLCFLVGEEQMELRSAEKVPFRQILIPGHDLASRHRFRSWLE
jgi:hypothetical protein